MSTHRYISTAFWDDEWITGLDPSEKLLYMYFLTNPLTSISGIYKITNKRISFDTGFNIETITHIINKFETAGKVYRMEEYVVLPSWPKNQNWENSENIRKGIVKELMQLSKEELDFIRACGYKFPLEGIYQKLGYPLETPPRGIEGGSTILFNSILSNSILFNNKGVSEETPTPTNSEKPEKLPKQTRAKPFQPPTLEEVTEYCKERNNKVDPARWVDHYTSNGWKVGKTKMIDWRAAVRNWERNDYSAASPPKKHWDSGKEGVLMPKRTL